MVGENEKNDGFEKITYEIDGYKINVSGEYVLTGENVLDNLLNIFEKEREEKRNGD